VAGKTEGCGRNLATPRLELRLAPLPDPPGDDDRQRAALV